MRKNGPIADALIRRLAAFLSSSVLLFFPSCYIYIYIFAFYTAIVGACLYGLLNFPRPSVWWASLFLLRKEAACTLTLPHARARSVLFTRAAYCATLLYTSRCCVTMSNYAYMAPDELVEMLDNPDLLSKVAVIDCRDSDRNIGFLVNSISMPTISCTEEMYDGLAKTLFEEKKEIAVFHCAQSLVRGPKGANRFALAQKKLGYMIPAVYVLRGGWEAFYHRYGDVRPDLMHV
ncbi:hypothetical protein, conserved [Leishmania tarentolae]|uniref:Rhodanese domain-containing protein n=1 Tax=Leishmania tarentolae TaxID=5689 RepID=A0A640KVN7_LEITA|nr:hypothetical protein, conserved [Leishmania tarentolae]